ncbi:ABC transporter substrate-binding protein [Georgenia sp. H159]|uniref:ABC transporter substrate-binding protein n=1 Tax=Georgenia sp. H159 TaxID=3076115 RepID=UPI002D7A04FA|nr:ABC transporter substrate-binding protein [Georgenia sp. H159]
MKRRAMTIPAALAASALLLAACGGGDSEGQDAPPADEFDTEEPVTLSMTIWGNDDRAERYQQSIELFNEEYPNIDVQLNFAAWGDYWPARATEAASSSLPDIIQMDLSYLRQFGQRNQLLDLEPYLEEYIDVSTIDETVLASGELAEGTYAIPTGTNVLSLHYNQTVLDSLGVELPSEDYTWSEYNEWITTASEAGATADPQLYGGMDYTGVFWMFALYMTQQGNEVFNDEGIAFTKEDMAEWLNSTADLREGALTFPTDRTIQLAPKTGFTNNQVATEFNWDNMISLAIADSGTEDMGLLVPPSSEDGEKALFSKPAMFLSVAANTEAPEAAALLVDFLTNDPEVGGIFGTSRGLPASEEQREGVTLEGADALVADYEESVADDITATVPQPVEGFGALEATYLRLSEELGLGTITVDEFVDQWFAEAEQLLS